MNSQEKQEAFLELYEPCRESLVRFARAIVRNREDALDLVQETTLKAFDSFEKLKNPKAFTSYLFTIASRLNQRNSSRRKWFRSFSSYDEDQSPEENLKSAESAPDANHDIEALHMALDQLPAKQKEAVSLFEISGLSIKEIRDIQGGSIPGVKSRILRGRQALARILGVEDDNGPENGQKSDKKSVKFKQNKTNTLTIKQEAILRYRFFMPEVCHA